VQKLDTVPFLATIGGMVTFGLAEGIGIGCASALAMNFVNNRNSLDTTRMQFHEEPPTSAVPSTTAKMSINNDMGWPSMMPRMQVNEARGLHTMVGYMHQPGDDHTFEDCGGQDFDLDHTRSTVWQINGPINFVSMFEIENMVRRIKERKEDSPVGTIVVDMHGVTSLEFTGVEELVNRLVEVADGTPVKMVNCDNPIQIALDQVDPNRQIARFSKLSASPSSD
jgi:MFS superfamily sulfate permease-like transporter